MFKKIKAMFSSVKKAVKSFVASVKAQIQMVSFAVRSNLTTSTGEGYVDSGVKILIAVVIGALLLAGLYTLFNTNILPTLTTKIRELFNYAG